MTTPASGQPASPSAPADPATQFATGLQYLHGILAETVHAHDTALLAHPSCTTLVEVGTELSHTTTLLAAAKTTDDLQAVAASLKQARALIAQASQEPVHEGLGAKLSRALGHAADQYSSHSAVREQAPGAGYRPAYAQVAASPTVRVVETPVFLNTYGFGMDPFAQQFGGGYAVMAGDPMYAGQEFMPGVPGAFPGDQQSYDQGPWDQQAGGDGGGQVGNPGFDVGDQPQGGDWDTQGGGGGGGTVGGDPGYDVGSLGPDGGDQPQGGDWDTQGGGGGQAFDPGADPDDADSQQPDDSGGDWDQGDGGGADTGYDDGGGS